jgi:hypothetical protein
MCENSHTSGRVGWPMKSKNLSSVHIYINYNPTLSPTSITVDVVVVVVVVVVALVVFVVVVALVVVVVVVVVVLNFMGWKKNKCLAF